MVLSADIKYNKMGCTDAVYPDTYYYDPRNGGMNHGN